MNVNIPLTADVENMLRLRTAAAGQDVGTYPRKVVTESLVEEAAEVNSPPVVSPGEFTHRLDAWIALHPVLNHAIDDSHESIYAGRGE